MRIDNGGRLLHGVTTNTPVDSVAGAKVQVHNNASVITASFTGYGAHAGGSVVALGKSRSNTVGDATGAVSNGDTLGDIRFGGSDGTDMVTTACAIRGEVDGSVSSNTIPGRLVFSINGTQQMRINSAGQFRAGDECTSNRTSYRHQLSSTAGSGDVLSLQNPSNSDGQGIGLGFWARNTNNAAIEMVKLKAVVDESQANSTQKGSLRFLTNVSGSMGERMRIHHNGNVGIGATTAPCRVRIEGTSESTSATLQIVGTGVSTLLLGQDATGGVIRGQGGNSTLKFMVGGGGDDAAASGTEAMRIQANGNVMVGNSSHFTSNVAKFDVVHPGANTAPTYVSRFFQETNNTGTDHACLLVRHAAASGSSTATVIAFQNSGGSFLGTIKCTNSATSYNTTSDYRLKENVISISDGITRLKKLKPYRFNFIVDEAKTLYDGFLAHEASEVVPEAVVGEKDAVDSEGKIDPQGIDQSKLVPLLTAALQEEISKREALEARVAALEAA